MSAFDSPSAWRAIAYSALLLSGCAGGGGDGGSSATTAPAATSTARPVEQTDLQIAAAIYEGSARTPSGFYKELAPSGHATVATMHVKNTDVDPTLGNSSPEFELCTNDWNQALGWSEAAALNSPLYSNLVATNDDSRYFEFGRVQPSTPEVYVQERIYKCAYVDRAAANLRTTSGAAGQLNIRPLSADELRRLSEYFWQFTSFNNFGNVVLKSAGSATPVLEHTLHIATLVRDGISPGCDRIDVVAWRHQVNSTSGALVLDVKPLWSFGARESAGVAQLCST